MILLRLFVAAIDSPPKLCLLCPAFYFYINLRSIDREKR